MNLSSISNHIHLIIHTNPSEPGIRDVENWLKDPAVEVIRNFRKTYLQGLIEWDLEIKTSETVLSFLNPLFEKIKYCPLIWTIMDSSSSSIQNNLKCLTKALGYWLQWKTGYPMKTCSITKWKSMDNIYYFLEPKISDDLAKIQYIENSRLSLVPLSLDSDISVSSNPKQNISYSYVDSETRSDIQWLSSYYFPLSSQQRFISELKIEEFRNVYPLPITNLSILAFLRKDNPRNYSLKIVSEMPGIEIPIQTPNPTQIQTQNPTPTPSDSSTVQDPEFQIFIGQLEREIEFLKLEGIFTFPEISESISERELQIGVELLSQWGGNLSYQDENFLALNFSADTSMFELDSNWFRSTLQRLRNFELPEIPIRPIIFNSSLSSSDQKFQILFWGLWSFGQLRKRMSDRNPNLSISKIYIESDGTLKIPLVNLKSAKDYWSIFQLTESNSKQNEIRFECKNFLQAVGLRLLIFQNYPNSRSIIFVDGSSSTIQRIFLMVDTLPRFFEVDSKVLENLEQELISWLTTSPWIKLNPSFKIEFQDIDDRLMNQIPCLDPESGKFWGFISRIELEKLDLNLEILDRLSPEVQRSVKSNLTRRLSQNLIDYYRGLYSLKSDSKFLSISGLVPLEEEEILIHDQLKWTFVSEPLLLGNKSNNLSFSTKGSSVMSNFEFESFWISTLNSRNITIYGWPKNLSLSKKEFYSSKFQKLWESGFFLSPWARYFYQLTKTLSAVPFQIDPIILSTLDDIPSNQKSLNFLSMME